MKFVCEKNVLQSAAVTVSRAAASKSPVSAMEGILFEARQDSLKLTAFDSKIGMYSTVEADVQEPGAIILPAKFLVDLVRRLPDGMVSIESDGDFNVGIRCGRTDFHLVGLDPESFPELNVVNPRQTFRLPEGVLKSMISQTVFAVSTSDSRPLYMGVLFEVGTEDLTMVAIDGYRMARRNEEIQNQNMEPTSFIIPGTSLNEVERLCLPDGENDVVIALGDRHASFQVGATVLITRRLEGEFMNYRKSIPTSFLHEIVVEREEMMRVIDRVSLVIKEKQNSPIKMIVGDGNLQFFCTTSFGHAEDACLCEGSGGDLRIGFNDKYFMDALKAANEEKLRISMNTPTAPIIIEAAEGGKYLYMVLPVRLRDGD